MSSITNHRNNDNNNDITSSKRRNRRGRSRTKKVAGVSLAASLVYTIQSLLGFQYCCYVQEVNGFGIGSSSSPLSLSSTIINSNHVGSSRFHRRRLYNKLSFNGNSKSKSNSIIFGETLQATTAASATTTKRMNTSTGNSKDSISTSEEGEAAAESQASQLQEQQPSSTSTTSATSSSSPSLSLSQQQEQQPQQLSVVSYTGAFFLTIGILYQLATYTDPSSSSLVAMSSDSVLTTSDRGLQIAAANVADIVLPGSAEDLVGAALGESFAGIIGAASSFFLAFLLNIKGVTSGSMGSDTKSSSSDTTISSISIKSADADIIDDCDDGSKEKKGQRQQQQQKQELVNEAIAQSDFFLAQAGALPLLEALGLPPFVASLCGVLLASVPYELIKIGSKKRIELQKEEQSLNALLQKQQEQGINYDDNNQLCSLMSVDEESCTRVAVDKLVPVLEENNNNVNKVKENGQVVEVIADLMKWLEYKVLMNEFSGTGGLAFAGITGGAAGAASGSIVFVTLESAWFGMLASLSSQLYLDGLKYFVYTAEQQRKQGTADQQNAATMSSSILDNRSVDSNNREDSNSIENDDIRNRTVSQWIRLYTKKAITAAVLFGVYAGAQIPISHFCMQLLSGGINNCAGSNDFNLCMQTYINYNPPEAEIGAQLRALLVNLSSTYDEVFLEIPTFDAQLRAFLVSSSSVYMQLKYLF